MDLLIDETSCCFSCWENFKLGLFREFPAMKQLARVAGFHGVEELGKGPISLSDCPTTHTTVDKVSSL